MRTLALLAFVLMGIVAASSGAIRGVVNDGISNTLLLSEREGSYTGQGGARATAEFGETSVAGSVAKHTVWYRYVAPVSGRFIVDIADQNELRAELRLPGNPATTIPLQTIADGTSNTLLLQERMSVDLTRGQVVYLVVDCPLAFDFSWRFVEVANDSYKDAEQVVGPSGTVKRADKGATLGTLEASLGFTAPATWFQWTAPSTGTLYADLVGSRQLGNVKFGNYWIYVYTAVNGAPGSLVASAHGSSLLNATQVQFSTIAGQVYYFACHGELDHPDHEIWFSWYPPNSPGEFAWARSEYRVTEADGQFIMYLLRLRANSGTMANITITAQSGGSAAPATVGDDFQPDTFAMGSFGANRTIFVEPMILTDNTAESTESFSYKISDVSGGATIADGTSNTIFIGEDLPRGACGFPVRETRVREGETARVELRRLSNDTQSVAVGWRIKREGSCTVGVDLPDISGTAYIGANEFSTFIEIPTYQDGVFEDGEFFTVELDEPMADFPDGPPNTIVDGSSNTIVVVEDDDYFVPKRGRYAGVIHTEGWGALVKCSLSGAGVMSGAVNYRGVSYSFRGVVGPDGQVAVPLQRGNRVPLGLRLKFQEGWASCEASFRDPEGEWADGTVRLLPYDGRSAVAPQAGLYTVLCDGQGTVDVPFAMRGAVLGDGSVRFIGRMADGTPVSFGGSVAGSDRDGFGGGECAFVAPLYQRGGNFYGTFALGTGPLEPTGTSHQWWLKPWRPRDAIYPALPFQTAESRCVRYTPPTSGRVTDGFNASLGDGSVRFVGGDTLLDGTSNTINISERNKVTVTTDPDPTNCSIKIDPKTGLFTGRVTPPGGTGTNFYGVFVQGEYGYGLGFYLGAGKAGRVRLLPDDN
jgi:hypothetical protein